MLDFVCLLPSVPLPSPRLSLCSECLGTVDRISSCSIFSSPKNYSGKKFNILEHMTQRGFNEGCGDRFTVGASHTHVGFKCILLLLGFPGDSVVKNSPARVGNMSLSSGPRRFSGVGNGKPLQYSCLENSLDREIWQAIVSP